MLNVLAFVWALTLLSGIATGCDRGGTTIAEALELTTDVQDGAPLSASTVCRPGPPVSTAEAGCAAALLRQRGDALPNPPVSAPADAVILAALKDAVPNPDVHGAVIGLVEPGGRRVFAWGSAGPKREPLDAESVLEIGSVSKALLGVLLADMVRRGEVRLDQPIAELLPPHVHVPSRRGKPITLLDLATHTSGLPRMPDNVPHDQDPRVQAEYTIDRLYDFLRTHELAADPGARYGYSNFITVLGYALAHQVGTSFEALLRERVLAPLGMRDTGVTLTPAMSTRMTRTANKSGELRPYFVLPAFSASGGLKSTMNDMLAFAAANLASDDSAISAALRDSRRPHRPLGEGEFMGLGWATTRGGSAGLSGATYGYRAYLYVNPERERAVVVMTNAPEVDARALGLSMRNAVEPPW